MTGTDLVFSVDIGSSSVRAGFFDLAGREVGGPTREGHCLTLERGGKAELDPGELLARLVRVVDAALATVPPGASIVAVGLGTFWHGLLGLDAAGAPTTGIISWADTRAADAARTLRTDCGLADLHRISGCALHASYWPAKLRWLAGCCPEIVARTRYWVSPCDFLYLALFGTLTTSVSMASGTGLFDHRSVTWCDEAIGKLGLKVGDLPDISENPQVRLVPAYASRWPALDGVPWYPALGDGACSNVGSGCVGDDRLAIMLGTSGSMRRLWEAGDAGVVDSALWVCRLDRRWFAGGMALSEGGNTIVWALQTFRYGASPEQLEDAVAAAEPGDHGLVVLPFLTGQRSPGWREDRTAAFTGITGATTPIDLHRALMESVAIRFALLKERLDRAWPGRRRIVATGSALLRSPAWVGMFADCMGEDVECSPVAEATLRGAAIVAMQRSGNARSIADIETPAGSIIHPRPAAHRAFARLRARHEWLDDALSSMEATSS